MGLVYTEDGRTVTEPNIYSYPRYLSAKKTVDARALNQRVWFCFLDRLTDDLNGPLRILEVGGGVGATVERLVDALESRPVDQLQYTFVDAHAGNVETAKEDLKSWAEARGYQVSGGAGQTWSSRALEVTIQFVTQDLFEYASIYEGASFNAVIAQAILDIVNQTRAERTLRPLLQKGGLWYLPIHFDGVTAFQPGMTLDSQVEQLYHASMRQDSEEGGGHGGVHCGRRLLNDFLQSDASLLEAGASDWIVHPRDEEYLADEAYFLHHMLHFIETELRDHPSLDDGAFSGWLEERRRQINDGVLLYIAHQLDVLAQAS